MIEPHSSNFRVITTNFLGVQIFRKFTVIYSSGPKFSDRQVYANSVDQTASEEAA